MKDWDNTETLVLLLLLAIIAMSSASFESVDLSKPVFTVDNERIGYGNYYD